MFFFKDLIFCLLLIFTNCYYYLRVFIQYLFVRSSLFSKKDFLEVKSNDGKRSLKKFSVVVPTKNGKTNGIEKLILSIKNQTHQPDEIIIVDTGSTDGTEEYLNQNYKDLNLILFNGFYTDHGNARNMGYEQAKNDIVFCTTDDIRLDDEEFFEKLIELFVLKNFTAMSTNQRYISDLDHNEKCINQIQKNNFEEVLSYKPNKINKFFIELMNYKLSPQLSFLDSNAIFLNKKSLKSAPFNHRSDEDRGLFLNLIKSNENVGYCKNVFVSHEEKGFPTLGNEYYLNKRLASYLLGPKIMKRYPVFEDKRVFKIILNSYLFVLSRIASKDDFLEIKKSYSKYVEKMHSQEIKKNFSVLNIFFIMSFYLKIYLLSAHIGYNLTALQKSLIIFASEYAVLTNSYKKKHEIKIY